MTLRAAAQTAALDATLIAVLIATIPQGSTALAQATDTPDDPAAIVADALSALREADAVSLDWFTSYDDVIAGREKITSVRTGSHVVSAEGHFRVLWVEDDRTRGFYFDGKTATYHAADDGTYTSGPFEGTMGDLVLVLEGDYGFSLPVMELFVPGEAEDAIAAAEEAADLGTVLIAGRVARHLAFVLPEEDLQLWIAEDGEWPEILMAVGTDRYRIGWPTWRAYFYNWDFAPETDAESFVFTPSKDDRLVPLARQVAGAGGAPAAPE